MRIIAGSLKGRTLLSPTWDGLRPTSDRLRETLFNVLAPHIEGARVLDGYAGTGAVGIEALSRGAAHVTFVDSDPRAVNLVARNLERCGVTDRYAIIRVEFAGAGRRLGEGAFDLVLLDPPYGAAALAGALAAAATLVTEDGLVVIEHARRDPAPDTISGLQKTRDILSGDSVLSVYRPAGAGRGTAGAA